MTLTPLSKIAECYGLDYQRIPLLGWPEGFAGQLIELMIDPDFMHVPRVATSFINNEWQQDNMEDMTPKLPADDLREIMEWDK